MKETISISLSHLPWMSNRYLRMFIQKEINIYQCLHMNSIGFLFKLHCYCEIPPKTRNIICTWDRSSHPTPWPFSYFSDLSSLPVLFFLPCIHLDLPLLTTVFQWDKGVMGGWGIILRSLLIFLFLFVVTLLLWHPLSWINAEGMDLCRNSVIMKLFCIIWGGNFRQTELVHTLHCL